MMPSNSLTLPLLNTITVSSLSTHIACVDTKGYDYLRFNLSIGSAAAGETAVGTLQCFENETITVASNATAYTTVGNSPITQFVGAAAVSTSAGFVLPARSSTMSNTYRFNIDLKGRKRFVGIYFAPTLEVTDGPIAITADLERAEDGASIATASTAVRGCRLIVSG